MPSYWPGPAGVRGKRKRSSRTMGATCVALCVFVSALLVTAQDGVLPEYPAAGLPVLPFSPIRSFQRSFLPCVNNLNN